ncbi:MAG: UDP-N-acetylglucosamine 1-carboxyvinyltransferase [Candidatus Latescibacteria bacterium 4484_107]|nr:MAG: UDP-N-acetylglucosamine 1-carboxyvinyltransferase [Candidatus Latescibacteria bacterium 4484_107]
MERFIIEGGQPLTGTIRPAGNKNEALGVLPAALLTDEPVMLDHVPQIGDVLTLLEILSDLGVEIERLGEHKIVLDASGVSKTELQPELCHRIRGSMVLAGPMLARLGEVRLPRPGGDRIGRRRVDTHVMALEALGAQTELSRNYVMRTKRGLKGDDILLDEASVTATESTLMAATTARGTTILRNAASEPHVQQLCRMLNRMGARIAGIGSNVLTIEGVEKLHGTQHTIQADYMEVGSFIGMAAVTGSAVRIQRATPENMRMALMVFERMGVHVDIQGDDLWIPGGQRLRINPDLHGAIPQIYDAPWPGFPADLMSIALVVATQAEGTVLLFEKMFEGRMFFVDRLIGMGAAIVLCDPHRAVVVGPSTLYGDELISPDIRAGMALLIAAMCAEGTSVIHNIRQIDRGYERIDERLRALGAKIERAE